MLISYLKEGKLLVVADIPCRRAVPPLTRPIEDTLYGKDVEGISCLGSEFRQPPCETPRFPKPVVYPASPRFLKNYSPFPGGMER